MFFEYIFFSSKIHDGGLVTYFSTLSYLSSDTKNSFVTTNSRLNANSPVLNVMLNRTSVEAASGRVL